MTIYSGGFRQRLVADSVFYLIRDSLEAIGWFDSGRGHGPIFPRTEPYPNDVEIPINSLIIGETTTRDDDAEMGSNLGDVTTTFYVDFYAENEAVGKGLIHDVRDILRGRMAAIGRTSQTLTVYDWDMATPEVVAVCDIEDVVVDQARDFPKSWQQNWWMCRFDVLDTYG